MRKIILSILISVVALVIPAKSLAQESVQCNHTARNTVIAHRGFWQCEGSFENSLSSLRNAQQLGIYGCEFDINYTADDSIVVVHGPRHPADSDMIIQTTPYADVRNTLLGNGEQVPTLREYFELACTDRTTRLILEIKEHTTASRESAIVAKTLALADAMGVSNQIEYISFGWHICCELRRLNPAAQIHYLRGDKTPSQIKDADFNGIDYRYDIIRAHPEWITEAHALGLKVNVWTVNKEDDMRTALNMGVDFITTNRPKELISIIEKKM